MSSTKPGDGHEKVQMVMDRLLLRLPLFGDLINKSIHRPVDADACPPCLPLACLLLKALDSVAGASGNAVYAEATQRIQRDVSTGSALTTSMLATGACSRT